MIRWSYLLPRIVMAIVLILAAKYAVPWMLRWSAVHTLESATGAVASVDQVWFSPLRGKVRMDGVRIARRASSDTNLVEYQSAVFSIDLGAFARRRTVINRAEIRGLSFGTARTHATEDTETDPWNTDLSSHWSGLGSELGQQWWQSVATGLQTRVEDQFASVQLARQLSDKWRKQYDQLEQEIARCKQNAELFHRQLKRIPDLLRSGSGLDVIENTRRQGIELRDQMQQLRRRVAQLQTQILDDRATAQRALAQDRAKVHAVMHVARLDEGKLCDSLLTGEIHNWLDQVQPWFEIAHWLLAHPHAKSPQTRGVFIPLGKTDDVDGILVRYAALDGNIDLRGRALPFQGQAHNLCLSLEVPACFHFQIGSDPPAVVTLVLERTDQGVREAITIDAKQVPTQTQTWGSTKGLAFSIPPARAAVQLSAVFCNNEIDGNLKIQMTDVQLIPVVAPGPAAAQVQRRLATALADLDSLELTAHIAGPVGAPHIGIESNAGHALQQRVSAAFQQTLDEHADALAQQADAEIAKLFVQVQDELAQRQTRLLQQLDVGRQLVSSTRAPSVAARTGWKRLLSR